MEIILEKLFGHNMRVILKLETVIMKGMVQKMNLLYLQKLLIKLMTNGVHMGIYKVDL